ncbi:hypothetical protein [Streptomyces sp. NPDC051452]|uniref:hypothetical protein n=1 Tax=Streptomyces sp. NPDC051452 TaxID=3365654 RepID=UPI00379315FC
MTTTNPAEELRAAAARLRDDRNCDGFLVDCNSRELLEMIRVLLGAREPLIRWLEDAAVIHLPDSECGYCDSRRNLFNLPCPALAVARAISGLTDPGRGRSGHIEDRLSGASIYERLMRASGES